MKLLFISSLERSGSTILDLKLSGLPNAVSFGEVWRVIMPHGGGLDTVKSRRCTCGEKAHRCSLWSRVFSEIERQNSQTLAQRYDVFLSVVGSIYGKNTVVIDSSKSIQSMQALSQIKNAKVYVIHTVRDVRGWMLSIRKAERRKKELPWGKILEKDFRFFFLSYVRHNILRMIPLWLANEWLLRNKRLLNHIKSNQFPVLKTSYEELVFNTDSTVQKITDFLSLSSEEETIPCNKKTHVIRGNRTAFNSSPQDSLYYEPSWMSFWRCSAILACMPWVAYCNKRWVYGYLKINKAD